MENGKREKRFQTFAFVAAILAWGVTQTGFAEETAAAGDLVASEPASSPVKAIGNIDIRPSYTPVTGEYHTENAAELGFQITKDISVSYTQAANTNLYNPAASPEESGTMFYLDRGFLKTKVGNLLVDESKTLSLSYENRIYMPTAAYDRDAGLNSIMRNYLKLKKKVSETLTLTAMEIPIIHFNSRPGTPSSSGGTANPYFQNRVYLIADINLSKKLSLSVPVMFHQTRHNNFSAGAKNNDSWQFFVWTYPELDYAINDNLSVGIAFYSDNLINSDMSGLSIGSGLEKGIAQLAFMANI